MNGPDRPSAPPPHRPIRSFVARGRRTAAQQRALDDLAPRYEIPATDAPLDLDALFGRHAPRCVEIGFGNGDNLLALAAAHPERDFLGIEVHAPGVGRTLLEIHRLGLANVRVSRRDEVEVLSAQLPPQSVDELLILFPDPWHKKRHHKRRLIQPAFTDLVARVLKPGGRLHLATDWEPYAQHMLEVLAAHADFVSEAPAGASFVPRPASRPLTRFERRGARLGHRVFDLAYRRR